VFGNTLFDDDSNLRNTWTNYPKHPLQIEVPGSDRDWLKTHSILRDLTKFEESIGIEFTHMRLLSRAFSDRSLGYTDLSR